MNKRVGWKLLGVMLAVSLVALVASSAFAGLPTSEDDFAARVKEEAKTPEGALQLWFEGVFLYMKNDTRALGKKVLVTMTHNLGADFESKNTSARFIERMKQQQEIFRSYAQGSSPSNGYKMNPESFNLDVVKSEADPHGRGWNISLQSSGADRPRIVTLVQDEASGLWKVMKFDSLYVGIRKAE